MVDDISGGRALRYHFFGEVGKQLFEDLASAGEQAVQMSSLRNPFAGLVRFRERITFDNGYLVVVIRQGSSG